MKVADILGVNESTIRKFMENHGYMRVGSGFVLLDDMCNHREHTPNREKMTMENTDVINLHDLKENMMYLSSETETLKNIIKWFKARDDN